MNCIVLLLLLSCCGNSNNVRGGRDDCRRGEERPGRDERDCDRDRDRDRDCGRERERGERDRCDIPGISPSWNDGGCDVRPEPRRQDFSNFGRGETCGCEGKE